MARSRPAQGPARIRKPSRPAYKSDAAPVVVSTGTVSHPKHIPNQFNGKRLVPDATPKVVQR